MSGKVRRRKICRFNGIYTKTAYYYLYNSCTIDFPRQPIQFHPALPCPAMLSYLSIFLLRIQRNWPWLNLDSPTGTTPRSTPVAHQTLHLAPRCDILQLSPGAQSTESTQPNCNLKGPSIICPLSFGKLPALSLLPPSAHPALRRPGGSLWRKNVHHRPWGSS